MAARKKKSEEHKKQEITRSSAVEYLTFVAAQGEGGVEVVYADEDIWLSQKMMAVLYDVNVRTINEHLKKILADNELEEGSVIRKFRITASDGKNYNTRHYNLSAIISVGYKVNSERAVQFRKWATSVVKEFTIKGFAMDDERLKEGGTIKDWRNLHDFEIDFTRMPRDDSGKPEGENGLGLPAVVSRRRRERIGPARRSVAPKART